MRIVKGFVIRDVGGDKYAVATGEAAKKFRGMLKLNDVGAEMFELLKTETTVDEVVEKMKGIYDVEDEVVRKDVTAFIEQLKNADILA